MYVNTLESKEFVNTKENQQMNKEMFVPQEESMRFRLDKVVEAVSEGILGEMLKQDKKRRDSRSRLHHLQVNTETTKAYEYYWRLLKEYEKMPLKKQLESVLELFVDISCRFDPPMYSEEVWAYTDELYSDFWVEERKEDPPFRNISCIGSDSEELMAQAKMLFLYKEIRDHLYYLVKMVRNNKIENKMKTENNTQKPRRGNKKGKFAEAVDKMNEEYLSRFEDIDIGTDYDPSFTFPDEDSTPLENLPPEPVEEYVIVTNKKSSLDNLHLKLESYLKLAERILEKQKDDAKRYESLGRLYDHIDKENGGHLEDMAIPSTDEEYSILAHKLGLIDDFRERKEVGILSDFLQRVKNLINEGESVTYFGGETNIIDGWSWKPVKGIYPALVIMSCLLGAIRREMRQLHLQVKILTGECITKHVFPNLIPLFDEEKNEVIIKRNLVTDEDDDEEEQFWMVSPFDEPTGGAAPVETTDVTPTTPSKPSTKKNPPDTPIIDHICMDKERAQKLYRSLVHETIAWLVEPKNESEFVNRLTSKPGEKKIKLESLNQIYYITRYYIFSQKDKDENNIRNVKSKEWDIIKQIFDSENGNIDKVNTAYKKPQNYEKLDALMRKKSPKSRKKQGE